MNLRILLHGTILNAAILTSSAAFAQASNPTALHAVQQNCGTVLTPEDVVRVRELLATGHYSPPPVRRGAEPWVVPLTFHAVRRSDGSGAIPESVLNACVADANAFFAAAGMRFVRPLPTRFIDNDDFYSHVLSDSEMDALRTTNPVCGTINVYFTPGLGRCGVSSFTWSPVQGVLVSNNCLDPVENGNTTFAHEIGHYFNLLHTHDTGMGVECVDGSNCAVAGDLICDTPADPGLSGDNMNDRCQYTGTELNSCNGDPYSPQTWNLMSYAAPRTCQNGFTSGQHNVAASTLNTHRLVEWSPPYCGCGFLVWVDANYHEAAQIGSQTQPFELLGDGLDAACPGSMVFLRAGVYHAAPTVINQPATLNASGGIARIGL